MTGMRRTYVRDDPFTGTSKPTVRGSREHFFHFLLGYLLPVVHAETTFRWSRLFDRSGRFLVLDCGPLMTPILSETLRRMELPFDVVSPAEVEKRCYVQAWDFAKGSRRAVRAAADRVSAAWRNYDCPAADCPTSENLLIERSAPHQYYAAGGAEIGGYGTGRRGITNWPEVSDFLTGRNIKHALYEPGRHSLGCQIAVFQGARRIVGMRGAEWANAIWSRPGLRVRVLDPAPPADLLTRFFAQAGVRCEYALAPQPHAPENPHEVARFLTEP
jgi:hypothetical protein